MSQNRRALLFAIADYSPAPPIPYVRGDIPRMRRALNFMGIPADRIVAYGSGVEGSLEVTTSRMREIIQKFLGSATEGENLIIYFSGHGVEREGHRLLIPQDYSVAYPPPVSELISDVHIRVWARNSKAESVLVLIDACREKAELTLGADTSQTKSLDKQTNSAGTFASKEQPTTAIIFSCASGQHSGPERDKAACSAFTKAIAEALEADNEYARLADIINVAQSRLNEFSGTPPQKITPSDDSSAGRAGDPKDLIVKANPAAQFRDRLDNSEWVSKLMDLGVWQQLRSDCAPLATQVQAIALRAEDQVARAKVAMAHGWRGVDAPLRALQRIKNHIVDKTALAPADAAILLAVPFVYESVLASAEIALAGSGIALDPLSTPASPNLQPFWRAWRVACLNEDALDQRIRRLTERQNNTAAFDVATWRLIAFCHRAGELWDPVGDVTGHTGWVATEISDLVALAPVEDVRADNRVADILAAGRLLRFARLMFATFDDVNLDQSGHRHASLDSDARFGEGVSELRMDEVKVAHLLNFGARLALDARRLSPILVEHLGSDEVLTLQAVQEQLARAAWHERDHALTLGLDCIHEALDAALREAVDDLDIYLRRVLNSSSGQTAIVALLPTTFNAKGLKAKLHQGKPVYDTEHLRFSLEQGRVMRLLMGKQLYGDPDLALRELYQNALDACRYRRAHEAYLRTQYKPEFLALEFQGQIIFHLGTSGDGRRFIECIDNGIGMAPRHLRRLFARAGQRFTDSHEYHLDRARWEAVGIKFFPNSRFGIGVLSYFMLAEELEVESQRVGAPDDPLSEWIHARVLGSGSLFRIDQEATGAVKNGGTRVRLYLDDQERDFLSLRDSILEWLWLPEFRVLLNVEGAETIELAPGQPTPRFVTRHGPLLAMPNSKNSVEQERAFWTPANYTSHDRGKPLVLVDGILTKADNMDLGRLSRTVAINLTEELRPELSVDRREILSSEAGLKFLYDCANEGGWRALALWERPTLGPLLDLLQSMPRAVGQFSAALRAKEITCPDIVVGAHSQPALLPSSGFCDVDSVIFRSALETRYGYELWNPLSHPCVPPSWACLLANRLAELGNCGTVLPPRASLVARYAVSLNVGPCPIVTTRDMRYNDMTFFDLLCNTARTDLSIPDIAKIGRSLAERGVSIEASTISDSITLDERQRKFVEAASRFGAIVSAHLLTIFARELSIPPLQLADLVESLRPTGLEVDVEEYLGLATPREWPVNALSDFLGDISYRTPSVARLVVASSKLGVPLGEIANMARDLSVEVTIPNLGLLTGSNVVASEMYAALLSKDLDANPPYLDKINVAALLNAARRFTLHEIYEAVTELKNMGVVVVPDLDAFRSGLLVTDRERLILSNNLNGLPPFTDSLDENRLIEIRKHKLTSAEVERIFGLLDRKPFISIRGIISAAVSKKITFADAVDAIKPILPLCPDISDKLSRIKVTEFKKELLLRCGYSSGDLTVLSFWDLAGAAEDLDAPVSSWSGELDDLEILGVDVQTCRPFVEYCLEQEASAPTLQ